MKKIEFVYIVLFCFSLCGCVREDLFQSGNSGVETIPVQLSFAVPSIANTPMSYENQEKAQTSIHCKTVLNGIIDTVAVKRARSTNQEKPIYNLYVFQFDKEGKKVTVSKIDQTPTPVNSRINLSVALALGTDQTIYLVALGKQCDIDLTSVATKAELEKYKISYLQLSEGVYTSKIKSDEDIPYAGSVEGVEIIKLKGKEEGFLKFDPTSEFDGGIRLKCLVAKLSLYFKYEVSDYSIAGILLKSIPDKFGINPAVNAGEKYVELNTVETGDIQLDPSTGFSVASWFIAPNMQGENDLITVESERYEKNAPAAASYFELWANNRSDDTSYAIYSIYVGGNNTSDFNINANGYYKLYTSFNTLPEDKDLRIRTYQLKLITELYSSDKSTTGGYDVDSHYDIRPVTVEARRSKVQVEIFELGTTTPVADNCWLKVSTDDNYTDAYNNKTLGIKASRTLLVPTRIKFWLYNDEYVELDAPKRSVTVRVTTRGLSDDKIITSRDFVMTQRPIVSVGQLGGEIDKVTGQFTKGLGVSSIDEYNIPYTSSDRITQGIEWGYYGVSCSANDYKTDFFDDGKTATKNLAENPKNLILANNGSKLAQHALKNGKFDLYQYNHYNSYAARFCYDRNRDLDGDGEIKGDELKWYLPSLRQVVGLAVQWSNAEMKPLIIERNGTFLLSTYEVNISPFANSGYLSTGSTAMNFVVQNSPGNNAKDVRGRARCVRDLDNKKN